MDIENSWPKFPLINLLADDKGQAKRILFRGKEMRMIKLCEKMLEGLFNHLVRAHKRTISALECCNCLPHLNLSILNSKSC